MAEQPNDAEGRTKVVKARWRAKIAGVAEPTGRGAIVLPIQLLDDPGRYADVSIPLSRTEALIKQLEHVLQRERTLKAWRQSEAYSGE